MSLEAAAFKLSTFYVGLYALNHFNLTYDWEHQQVIKMWVEKIHNNNNNGSGIQAFVVYIKMNNKNAYGLFFVLYENMKRKERKKYEKAELFATMRIFNFLLLCFI